MPGTKRKPVPEFPSEDAERQFWAERDSTEFIDWQSAERRKLPNLKPIPRPIQSAEVIRVMREPNVRRSRPGDPGKA